MPRVQHFLLAALLIIMAATPAAATQHLTGEAFDGLRWGTPVTALPPFLGTAKKLIEPVVTDQNMYHYALSSAMSIADTQDFGILRLIVSDEKKAREILSNYSIVTSIEVIAVKISDKAGALCGVLDALGDAGINIEYTYAFTASADFGAYAVMRVEDNAAAEKVLHERGFATLENADIGKI